MISILLKGYTLDIKSVLNDNNRFLEEHPEFKRITLTVEVDDSEFRKLVQECVRQEMIKEMNMIMIRGRLHDR